MHEVTTKPLSLARLKTLILEDSKLKLSVEVIQKIQECRAYLDQKIATTSDPIYGINTGFGALCDVRIHSENLTKLQENLVRSHACGTGDLVPKLLRLASIWRRSELLLGRG